MSGAPRARGRRVLGCAPFAALVCFVAACGSSDGSSGDNLSDASIPGDTGSLDGSRTDATRPGVDASSEAATPADATPDSNDAPTATSDASDANAASDAGVDAPPDVGVDAAVAVTSVSVSPSATTAPVRSSQQFIASVSPASVNQAVTWAVQELVGCGAVTPAGLYTAPTVVPAGACHVVATSVADGTKSASAVVTLTAAVFASLAINPASVTLQVGGSRSFFLSENPSGTFATATWVVQEGAGCGSVDATGNYAAPANVPAGSCHVVATSVLDPTLSATATVTVVARQITSVTVTPAVATTQLGAAQEFLAAVAPAGSDPSVTWSVPEGPTCGTVSASGLYFAPLAQPSGSCHVVATSADPTKFASATITLVAASIATFEVLPAAATVQINATQQFMAIAGPAGAGHAATWVVQEGASCGTVSASGLYLAPASVPSGTCHVVATSAIDLAKSATAVITVCTSGASCAPAHFTEVWGGARHCIALRSDASAWAWGYNWAGKLDDGTLTERHTAIQMLGPGGVGHLSAVAVMGGESHDFVLVADGTVWSAGWNFFGQLGDGTNTESSLLVRVRGLGGVTALGGRGYHSLAIGAGGLVWAWGDNQSSELGNGGNAASNVPVQVTGSFNPVAITGGGFHSLAILPNNTLVAWGRNGQGELGIGSVADQSTPAAVGGLSGVIQVSAGWEHTVALTSDRTVWTWGSNSGGQLGDGTTTNSPVPLHVSGLDNVVAVSAGDCHTAALRADGTVWTWGCNGVGELGNGNNVDRHAPTQVLGLSGVTKIAARDYHNVVIKSDDTLWTWGFNADGQLGDNTTTDRNMPVQVQGLP
jgi:alpha-tubulin suppressor-like RCC1 family protein